MTQWLRTPTVRTLASQLLGLSIVTSLALNTTIQLRQRDERNRLYIKQKEILTTLLQQLRSGQRITHTQESHICKQLVKVGLHPEDFGFQGDHVREAKEVTTHVHEPLNWRDVLFGGADLVRTTPMSSALDAKRRDEDAKWEKGEHGLGIHNTNTTLCRFRTVFDAARGGGRDWMNIAYLNTSEQMV